MFTKFLCNLTYGLSRARYKELTGDPRHCSCCHWVAWENTCGLLWRDLIQIQIKQNTNDCIDWGYRIDFYQWGEVNISLGRRTTFRRGVLDHHQISPIVGGTGEPLRG